MFWQIVFNVGMILLSALLYQPPPGPKALKAKDLDTPKSEEGAVIYDGAGTFWVSDAHVIWSGDFDSKGIYKKGGKK